MALYDILVVIPLSKVFVVVFQSPLLGRLSHHFCDMVDMNFLIFIVLILYSDLWDRLGLAIVLLLDL